MYQPLTFRLRPTDFNEFFGQKHLLGANGILTKFLKNNYLPSMIFYGPPGTGKTTVARIIAKKVSLPIFFFNAATGSKKDLEEPIKEAIKNNQTLILVVDEIHRLNKDKQDYLLPIIEDGTIVLIGLTTANPFFSINPAIRSRVQLMEFKPLDNNDIKEGILYALNSPKGYDNKYNANELYLNKLSNYSGGDLRTTLNILEASVNLLSDDQDTLNIDILEKLNLTSYSNNMGTEDFYYNIVSALQKSIRGSDTDAALYYLALALKSGDLVGIMRRIMVTAYEDVGLADMNLCNMALTVYEVVMKLGLPEARIPLSDYVIRLCLAPKSKAGYKGINKAIELAEERVYDMPYYLRLHNKRTPLYDYERLDVVDKIQYLPDELAGVDMVSFGDTKAESILKERYLKLKDRSSDLNFVYKKKEV